MGPLFFILYDKKKVKGYKTLTHTKMIEDKTNEHNNKKKIDRKPLLKRRDAKNKIETLKKDNAYPLVLI